MKISKEQLISVVDKFVSLSFDSYSFTYERVPVGSLHSGQSKPVVKICPHSGFKSLPSYHVSFYRDSSIASITIKISNPSVIWHLDGMPYEDAVTIFNPLLARFEAFESFYLDRFLSEWCFSLYNALVGGVTSSHCFFFS